MQVSFAQLWWYSYPNKHLLSAIVTECSLLLVAFPFPLNIVSLNIEHKTSFPIPHTSPTRVRFTSTHSYCLALRNGLRCTHWSTLFACSTHYARTSCLSWVSKIFLRVFKNYIFTTRFTRCFNSPSTLLALS